MQVIRGAERTEGPQRAAPPPTAGTAAPAPQAQTASPSGAPIGDAKSGPSFVPLLTRPQGAGTSPSAVLPPLAPRPPLAEGVTRVALLLPLSGHGSALGQSMLNAAELAMFSFAGDGFELLPQDTRGEAAGAESAAAAAIADGASIILGPVFAPAVRAVREHAQLANVPVIAFSSDRSVAGNGVYTLGLLPGDQVRAVVEHALSKGLSRFAVLAPNDSYGATVIDALKGALAQGGGSLVRTATFQPGADDFTDVVRSLADYDTRRQALLAQIKELKANEDEISKLALKRLEHLQTLGELPYDALLIAAGGKQLQNIAAHLPFFDIDPKKVRMLGTGLWDSPGIGAEPALVGGWFAAPLPKDRAVFISQYKGVFGTDPARLATLAYDATALAAVLAQADGGADYSAATLTQPGGFAGRDGIFRFTSQGLAERGLAVLEVRQRDFQVVRAAPTSFAQPSN